jgi:hypothetical protein
MRNQRNKVVLPIGMASAHRPTRRLNNNKPSRSSRLRSWLFFHQFTLPPTIVEHFVMHGIQGGNRTCHSHINVLSIVFIIHSPDASFHVPSRHMLNKIRAEPMRQQINRSLDVGEPIHPLEKLSTTTYKSAAVTRKQQVRITQHIRHHIDNVQSKRGVSTCLPGTAAKRMRASKH